MSPLSGLFLGRDSGTDRLFWKVFFQFDRSEPRGQERCRGLYSSFPYLSRPLWMRLRVFSAASSRFWTQHDYDDYAIFALICADGSLLVASRLLVLRALFFFSFLLRVLWSLRTPVVFLSVWRNRSLVLESILSVHFETITMPKYRSNGEAEVRPVVAGRSRPPARVHILAENHSQPGSRPQRRLRE